MKPLFTKSRERNRCHWLTYLRKICNQTVSLGKHFPCKTRNQDKGSAKKEENKRNRSKNNDPIPSPPPKAKCLNADERTRRQQSMLVREMYLSNLLQCLNYDKRAKSPALPFAEVPAHQSVGFLSLLSHLNLFPVHGSPILLLVTACTSQLSTELLHAIK